MGFAIAATLLAAAAVKGNAQVTFAGSQVQVGNGGLNAPSAMTVDGKSNLYVADTGNNRIVRFAYSTTGYANATTLVGNLSGPTGVAADWTGNVYIADTGNNRILMLPLTGTTFGAAVVAGTGFSKPQGVAVDASGNLFVADTGNNRIVELPRLSNGFGSAITVGTGYSSPASVAVDTAHNLFIADTGNNQIVKEAYTSGSYPTQTILFKNFSSPQAIVVDKSDNLYIADTGSGRIIEEPWAAAANRFGTKSIIGNGFTAPQGVIPGLNSTVLVSDSTNGALWSVMTTSASFAAINAHTSSLPQTYSFNVVAGTSIGGVGIFAQGITGADYNDAGQSTCTVQTYAAATLCSVNVIFTPQGTGVRPGAIVIYDANGNALSTAYLSGTGYMAQVGFTPGVATILGQQLSAPAGVAVDGAGDVFVSDTGNNRVVEILAGGQQITLPVNQLSSPMGLAVDGAGNLYIVSNGNDKIVKLPWIGTGYGPQSKIAASLYGPTNAILDANGNMFVADMLDNRVDELPWAGTGYAQALSLGNYRKTPTGVAVDPHGNVFFTMPYQNNVTEIPLLNGVYQNQVSLPMTGISFPAAIASDSNSNIYVLDSGNNRVLMLPWNGTAYGTQTVVASGFNAPTGLAVDPAGNLYIADTGNNQVVKIDLSAPSSMAFNTTYLGTTSNDSAHVQTVHNIGNLPLTVASVASTVNFPADNAFSNPCLAGAVMKPGVNCSLALDFIPQASGALNETMNVELETANGATLKSAFSVSGTSIGRSTQSINFATIPQASYGTATMALSATATSGLPVTFTVVSGPGKMSAGRSVVNVLGIGTIVIQAVQGGNTSYTAATSVTRSFKVVRGTLTVTPANATAVYGAVPAALAYTVTGFVGGDTLASAVTGKAKVTLTSSHPAVGSWTLTATAGTLAANNYTFVYGKAKLTVTKAILKISSAATRVYGQAMPTLTYTATGLVNGDTTAILTGKPKLTCTATTSGAGTYAIQVAAGTLASPNYQFVFSNGVLTVTPAVLIVTPSAATMTYGGTLPAFTWTATGLIKGDTLATAVKGLPAYATKANAHSVVGTVPVTATLGTLTATNYSFNFAPGTLTITKAVATVTAANFTIKAGSAIPTLTYKVTGLLNGDTAGASVTGTPTLTTTATKTSVAGSYPITIKLGTMSAANYTLTAVNGTLTVQ